jgi:choline dehydrogenase-like flavoprotein
VSHLVRIFLVREESKTVYTWFLAGHVIGKAPGFVCRTLANSNQRWQRYVDPDGKRQDAAHRYVHPLLQDGQHPNLHILVESKVIRVLFDESSPPRAIGIEYKPNPEHQLETALSKPIHKIVKATKLVIVSAGALGTPQVLERSGVGSPSILKSLDIPVIANVPVSIHTSRVF